MTLIKTNSRKNKSANNQLTHQQKSSLTQILSDQNVTKPTQTASSISQGKKNCFKNLNKLDISYEDNNGPTPERVLRRTKGGVKAMSRD